VSQRSNRKTCSHVCSLPRTTAVISMSATIIGMVTSAMAKQQSRHREAALCSRG
jgi:hypothetical protein